MSTRGYLLDRSVTEVEASAFAKEYGFSARGRAAPQPDPKLLGWRRFSLGNGLVGEAASVELIVNAEDATEVAALWIDRRALNDRAQVPTLVQVYAAFLRDALGEVGAADKEGVGNLLAVSYEIAKNFEPVTRAFPFVPKDGVGAATEVFLGRRVEASVNVRGRAATLIVRNDPSGRLFVAIASQRASFDLNALLFAAPVAFSKGDRGGVAGFKTPDLDATPFGRRWGVELDRAAPPKGRIARRHYGFARVPRTAKLEVLTEPTRGLAGVLLRLDQDWIQDSDTNFFAALELLATFIAEGIGDAPDARTRVEIADLLACGPDDGDLYKVIKAALPFVERGKQGSGTAVFVGEAESAAVFLDEGRVAVVVHENEDGWLDCLFHLCEFHEIIGAPAVPAPEA
jgi:hypothetical protein